MTKKGVGALITTVWSHIKDFINSIVNKAKNTGGASELVEQLGKKPIISPNRFDKIAMDDPVRIARTLNTSKKNSINELVNKYSKGPVSSLKPNTIKTYT